MYCLETTIKPYITFPSSQSDRNTNSYFKMVTEKMWKSIQFFSKLFPPNIILYDTKNTLFRTINKVKHFHWLAFYFGYSIPNLVTLNILLFFRNINGDFSASGKAVQIAINCLCSFETAIYIFCAHTLVKNEGGFILLFNTMSTFQRSFPGM